MKTILPIYSMAFSGSTLLDAMLDSQHRVASLGEISQLWEAKPPGIRRGPCHICGSDAASCSFWNDRGDLNPYDHAFAKSGAAFVVDSSKDPVRFTAFPPEYRVRPVALFKLPHEWAYSVRGHDKMKGEPTSLDECFFHWENLAGVILHYTRETGAFLLAYRDLTRRPEELLGALALYAGFHFDPAPIRARAFWKRKSHALGGNSAVIDQERNEETEIGERATWLAGKYVADARWRRVCYDNTWESDAAFRAECERCYLAATPRLRLFLNRLGFGSPEKLAADMRPL